MRGAQFLEHIWQHQPEGYRFVVFRHGGKWLEKVLKPTESLGTLLLPKGGDMYFAPNVFSEPIRQKEYCLPSRVMYQDLDEVRPDECPLYPDLSWETSLQRWQGLWFLETLIEPAEFAALNRGLNRACGADPGTWNLTRVLRVPGSWNGKRGCRVSEATKSPSVVAA